MSFLVFSLLHLNNILLEAHVDFHGGIERAFEVVLAFLLVFVRLRLDHDTFVRPVVRADLHGGRVSLNLAIHATNQRLEVTLMIWRPIRR